jgi:hypothetical protein
MFNRMKITRADGTGKMPWSPTVANIYRQRSRRRKHWLIIGAIVMLVVCVICGVSVKLYKPKSARATPMPVIKLSATPAAAAPAVAPTSAPTPAAKWTPVGDNPLIGFRVEPYSNARMQLTPTRVAP